jgi:urease accessory protein
MAAGTRFLRNMPAAPGGGAGALALLLLADGRFPAGGHAHSAGVEAAVADGRVDGVASLEDYVRGRLWTAGLTDAALAAATVLRLGESAPAGPVLAVVDDEAEARVVSPPLRAASRRLGAQLVRAAGRAWGGAVLDSAAGVHPAGLHQPVALGAAAHAAGAGPDGAAALAAHHTLTTPAQAAVRLLGLDPFEATAVVARLGPEAARVVAEALVAAAGPLRELPCRAGPLVDIVAVHHAASDRRLFVT